MKYAFFCLLCAGPANLASISADKRLVVDWNVPVTSPGGNHLNWYEMKTDPEDPNNLIVCGAKRNAHDNAYYGVVYFSRDGGKSWTTALEDHGSTWVTEQSCAFGRQHRAYFISEASKVVDTAAYHELGTTHIFVSSNGGETWIETSQTGWADYSSSVVRVTPGVDDQQLYVFYNDGNALGFFSVSSDGRKVSQPRKVSDMTAKHYKGVFPSSSLELNDGTLVVLYDAGKKSDTGNKHFPLEMGVVRLAPDGQPLSVVVGTHTVRYAPPTCPATLSNSLAYDNARNLLYVAYNDIVSGHCGVMLTSSQDGGQTWSDAHELALVGKPRTSMYLPVLAINQDGVIGLLWRGRPDKSPGCWNFSTSRDGLRLDASVPLAVCLEGSSLKEQSSEYLATVIEQWQPSRPVEVQLMTFRDYLIRVGINATPDGVFHPLWSTSGDGNGELRTARIRIGEHTDLTATHNDKRPPALTDITDEIAVSYGGEQRLDHATNSATLDISFRNNASTKLVGPLYLRIDSVTSDFGKIEVVNSPALSDPSGNYLDLTSSLRNDSLGSKETSLPYRLMFHFGNRTRSVASRYIFDMKLRLFSGHPRSVRSSSGCNCCQGP